MEKERIDELLALNSKLTKARTFREFVNSHSGDWQIASVDKYKSEYEYRCYIPEALQYVIKQLADKEVKRIEKELEEL